MSMHQYITAIKNYLPRARSCPLICFSAIKSCVRRLIAFTEERKKLYAIATRSHIRKKLIDHSKHLRELWFWGVENVNWTRTRFTGSFNWKTTFHSLGAFMFMFHVYQKARASAHVNCHWYSALCFIVLNALLVLIHTAHGHSSKAHQFIIITCGILNSCPKVLFISTYFQFHAASITPAPLRWQRLSHRLLLLLKDDEWSAELQVKDDVWSPAADGSVSVTAHQWRPWWTSGWKRALIKEPHAQQRICRPSPVCCHRGWIQ